MLAAAPLMKTPVSFPSGPVPWMLVPMKLPSTRLLVAPEPRIWTPTPLPAALLLPEMTLIALGVVPPIVFPRAVDEHTDKVGHGGFAGRVGADVVALHQVGDRVAAADLDAGCTVAREDVAEHGRGPADRVAGCGVQEDAVASISQGKAAEDVGTDKVSDDEASQERSPTRRRLNAADGNAVLPVARDDVAGQGREATDRIPCGTSDRDAVAPVAQGPLTRDVGANEVAQHQVARRSGQRDRDAILAVARDDIVGPGQGQPDDIVAHW